MSTELKDKPKPRPPDASQRGYRGGIFDHIDVPAITSFVVCLLLFILILVGIRSVDYSALNKPTLEDLSDRVSKIIMPLKPPGKAIPKPEEPKAGAGAAKRRAPVGAPGDASALGRIERSRKTVTEQIGKVQERITKAAVLSILSGKGPATAGRTVGRSAGKSDKFAGWGDLDSKLGSIEGLTKFDGKQGDFNQDGAPPAQTKGDAIASGLENMVKGFDNAKKGALSKIGVADAGEPEALVRSPKFTGNRSPSDVASFINKKQSQVSMLYEERLKSNPTLEGKVTVIMVIEEDGTVSTASILRSETTLDDPDFTAELLRRIKRWIFPPSSNGPVEMKSPFLFRPA
jgi:protein TonB